MTIVLRRLALALLLAAAAVGCGTMFIFSSMSNSLSHIEAKTMRPT